MSLEINWPEILQKMQLPGRYSAAETPGYAPTKDGKRFLLCFPDDYSIGMSSLGFHTIGSIVHGHPGFSCERCFAPPADIESWMRKTATPLFSLETKSPASCFDIIGFSMQYELTFTNFINMLELAGLEPLRKNRSAGPILLGGGPSCVNPALLGEFFDLMVLGEAEPVLPLLLDMYVQSEDREVFLGNAALLEGVCVPGLSRNVKLAVFKEFDNRYYPCSPPVAVTQSTHARINIEINRGCRHSCRFCQASAIYSPYREKTRSQIIDAAAASLASTGYDEITLTSLSGTDHPDIIEIMDDLYYAFRDLGVSVMMSSMRPAHFSGRLSQRMARLRRGGVTFAPETPSERLKGVIGKNIPNSLVLDAAAAASRMGWKKIKLYFMIGLPGETFDDIKEIPGFIREVKKAAGGIAVNASVSPLVPQPHTPFQWLPLEDPDILFDKAEYIRRKSPDKGSAFRREQYIIECILARAGSSLAGVLRMAQSEGARFDQWSEHFDFCAWERAFESCGTDWREQYFRKYAEDEPLPWDSVIAGSGKDFLLKSYASMKKDIL